MIVIMNMWIVLQIIFEEYPVVQEGVHPQLDLMPHFSGSGYP